MTSLRKQMLDMSMRLFFTGLALTVILNEAWKVGVVVMALAILIVVGVETCTLLDMRRTHGKRGRRRRR